jgi:outer membrane protein assembly factor BamE (lipoprotein component of BamABCDE complex)
MPLSDKSGRVLSVMAAAVLTVALAGCQSSIAPFAGFTATRTQGYEIPDSALQQIRTGQHKDLVEIVLGSPQTTNTLDGELTYYYIETIVERTAFGLETVKERTVLAVYFDENDRVIDRAVYGLEDGRVIAIEGRRTESFGNDRSFVESLLLSVLN